MTVNGLGTSLLLGTNTYTGSTTILSGTVPLSSNVAFGTPGPLGNSTNPIFIGDSSGSNSAALVTSGAFTVSRNLTIQAGSAGTATLSGNSANLSTFSGNITLNKNVTLNQLIGGTANFTGIVAGPFGVTVGSTGNGTVALSGLNTYTGSTTFGNGTLQVSTLANGGIASSLAPPATPPATWFSATPPPISR